jgi:hypothetical protein
MPGYLSLSPTVPEESVAKPAPLARAMGIFMEEMPASVVGGMSASLETILQWVNNSKWLDVAWEFSRLTGDGFPVEFTFSSSSPIPSYTAEVAGAEVPDADRLPLALDLIEDLSGLKPASDISKLLNQVQACGNLSYGAWISGRHDIHGGRYKVYVEVPRSGMLAARHLCNDLLNEEPLLNSRATQFRMIGYEPSRQQMEFYFQVEQLEKWELERLLHRVNLGSRQSELLGLLEETYGRPMEGSVPNANLGFSYSFAFCGGPAIFSLFSYARSVFGSDQSVRRKLLAMGVRNEWDLRIYQRLSEPVATRTGWRTRHGLLAFIVPNEGSLSVRIGIRPPAAPQDLE